MSGFQVLVLFLVIAVALYIIMKYKMMGGMLRYANFNNVSADNNLGIENSTDILYSVVLRYHVLLNTITEKTFDNFLIDLHNKHDIKYDKYISRVDNITEIETWEVPFEMPNWSADKMSSFKYEFDKQLALFEHVTGYRTVEYSPNYLCKYDDEWACHLRAVVGEDYYENFGKVISNATKDYVAKRGIDLINFTRQVYGLKDSSRLPKKSAPADTTVDLLNSMGIAHVDVEVYGMFDRRYLRIIRIKPKKNTYYPDLKIPHTVTFSGGGHVERLRIVRKDEMKSYKNDNVATAQFFINEALNNPQDKRVQVNLCVNALKMLYDNDYSNSYSLELPEFDPLLDLPNLITGVVQLKDIRIGAEEEFSEDGSANPVFPLYNLLFGVQDREKLGYDNDKNRKHMPTSLEQESAEDLEEYF